MIGAILGSRFAWAGIALAAALGWHYIDKAAAVRSAEQELADKVEIGTLQAQLAAAQRRAQAAKTANENLLSQIGAAEQEADQARVELEEYERNFQVNAECVVDPGVLDRLRNN